MYLAKLTRWSKMSQPASIYSQFGFESILILLFPLLVIIFSSCESKEKVNSSSANFSSREDSVAIAPLEEQIDKAIYSTRPQDARPLIEKLREYSIAHNYDLGIMMYYRDKTFLTATRLTKFADGEAIADSAVVFAKGKPPLFQFIAKGCQAVARLVNNEKKDSAIFFFLEAEKIAINNPELCGYGAICGRLYVNIALLYMGQRNYSAANEYYEKSMRFFIDKQDSFALVKALVGLSITNLSLGDTASCYVNLLDAIAISEECKSSTNIALCSKLLGEYYYSRGSYDSASRYFKRAIKPELPIFMAVVNSAQFSMLAEISLSKGNLDSAKYWMNGARILRDSMYENLSDQRLYFETLAHLFKSEGQYKDAIYAILEAQKLQSEITKQESKEQLLRYEKEIKKINYERELTRRNNTLQTKRMIAEISFLATVLVSIAVGILLWIKYRKKTILLKLENESLVFESFFYQIDPTFISFTLQPLKRMIQSSKDIYILEYISIYAKLMRNMINGQRQKLVTAAFNHRLLENYFSVIQQRDDLDIVYEINSSMTQAQQEKLIPNFFIFPIIERLVTEIATNNLKIYFKIDIIPETDYLTVNISHSDPSFNKVIFINNDLCKRLIKNLKPYKSRYSRCNLAVFQDSIGGRIAVTLPLFNITNNDA